MHVVMYIYIYIYIYIYVCVCVCVCVGVCVCVCACVCVCVCVCEFQDEIILWGEECKTLEKGKKVIYWNSLGGKDDIFLYLE